MYHLQRDIFGERKVTVNTLSLIPQKMGGYKTKTEDLRLKNEDPFKIVLKSLEKGSNMIFDRSRNKEQQYLRFSTNLTRVFVLYITLILPKVNFEDFFKIALKSLQNGSNMIIDRSRNKEQQDLRLSTNLTRVFFDRESCSSLTHE